MLSCFAYCRSNESCSSTNNPPSRQEVLPGDIPGQHSVDSGLLVPDGVVGQHGRRDGEDTARGDGADLPGGRDLHPGPDHFRHRGEEGLRRHGRLLFGRQQHIRRDRRVSDGIPSRAINNGSGRSRHCKRPY